MEKLPAHPTATAGRPPRQPRRTLIAGLVLLVFMLLVWFQAPGVRLPTFFQRLVGLANALVAMLVVVFAIREYAKRYNRLPLPWFGRISTSRVAGMATFLAVCLWWLSPWAPLPADRGEPDLSRLLEQPLSMPLLSLDDAELATINPPAPSRAAREAAADVTATDPFHRALVAMANRHFDAAAALLDQATPSAAADRESLDLALAQLDCYAARYSSASRRFGELLRLRPRFYDYLAQGALAAALVGDYAEADQRAQQLFEQARALGRESPRLIQAVNLLAAVRILEGRFAEARQIMQDTQAARDRAARSGDRSGYNSPPLAADVNNAAVVSLLYPLTDDTSPADALAWAKRLWTDATGRRGLPRELADLHASLEWHNLGMVALRQSRFDHAEQLLNEARSLREQAGGERDNPRLGITLSALAEVSRIKADYAAAEKLLTRAAELLASLSATDPNRLPPEATRARLEADLGEYSSAERDFLHLIHAAESSLAPRHPYVAANMLQLAELFLQTERPADALKLADEAAAMLKTAQIAPPQPPGDAGRAAAAQTRGLPPIEAAQAARIAGLAAVRLGDRDLAQRKLDEAAQILAESGTPKSDETPSAALESADMAAARAELATVLETYSSAQTDYREALRLLDLTFGAAAKQHPLRADYLAGLARLYVRQKNAAAAVAPLEESLAIREAALPAGHPATRAALKQLADLKDQLGDAAAARKLRDRAENLSKVGRPTEKSP